MTSGQDPEDPLDYEDLYQWAVSEACQKSTFVEIGAFLGRSAIKMAQLIERSRKSIDFFVVDTWLGSAGADPNQDEILNRSIGGGLETGRVWEMFVANVRRYQLSHRIKPLQMLSVTAAHQFDDHSLDFVFIDATHTYPGLMSDLYAWYAKVRPGGVIAGHDYVRGWDGVIRAVDEFFGGLAQPHPPQSWIFRKPIDETFEPAGFARRTSARIPI